MQKHFAPQKPLPIRNWEKELATKFAEKDKLNREYHKLKDDTAKIERIQRSVKEILHSESPERAQRKSRGVEL
jgi:hypothetical protein